MRHGLPVIAAFALALSGGCYFGLFSCGGDAWHEEAFFCVLVALVVVALMSSREHRRPLLSRLFVLLGVPAVFAIAEAAAAPFYPAAPGSWQEFSRGFLSAFERGPC